MLNRKILISRFFFQSFLAKQKRLSYHKQTSFENLNSPTFQWKTWRTLFHWFDPIQSTLDDDFIALYSKIKKNDGNYEFKSYKFGIFHPNWLLLYWISSTLISITQYFYGLNLHCMFYSWKLEILFKSSECFRIQYFSQKAVEPNSINWIQN